MLALHKSLTMVHSDEVDTRRRGRNLILLALAMATLCVAFVPQSLGQPGGQITVAMLIVAGLVFVGVAFLGRAGHVATGAWVMILMTIMTVFFALITSFTSAASVTTPFFLVLAILLAGVLLPPSQIWSVLVICLLGLALIIGLYPADSTVKAAMQANVTSSSLMLVMVAIISFVSSSGIIQALAEAQAARQEAVAATEALSLANSSLEARVAERTLAFEQLAEEQRVVATELQSSLEAQQELNRIVAELAVPVLPVSADTLVVPLVGNIDSARAELTLAQVLTHVERDQARTVILDVTGVAIVDTQVAASLIQVAAATRLMGAETVLAGIRPEVAQALVHLGVDLSNLRTVATLQESLRQGW